ncbi:unnamed protein product [Dovyalis caffra]|uniref:Uncharacterized protein n=1 Tax=Dovyalis caffra TaxID=77055 RepID=A0AAV1SS66_9ROSI|nr:unnamed protein product [Dovyalis caffra]
MQKGCLARGGAALVLACKEIRGGDGLASKSYCVGSLGLGGLMALAFEELLAVRAAVGGTSVRELLLRGANAMGCSVRLIVVRAAVGGSAVGELVAGRCWRCGLHCEATSWLLGDGVCESELWAREAVRQSCGCGCSRGACGRERLLALRGEGCEGGWWAMVFARAGCGRERLSQRVGWAKEMSFLC